MTPPPGLYIRPMRTKAKALEIAAICKLHLRMDPSKISDPMEEDPKAEHLDRVPSHLFVTHDDVFGELTEDGPNYRNVHTCIHPR